MVQLPNQFSPPCYCNKADFNMWLSENVPAHAELSCFITPDMEELLATVSSSELCLLKLSLLKS